MSKKWIAIILVVMSLIGMGYGLDYKHRKNEEKKVQEYLLNKGYQREDIAEMRSVHDWLKGLYKVFVKFSDEMDAEYTYARVDSKVIQIGFPQKAIMHRESLKLRSLKRKDENQN